MKTENTPENKAAFMAMYLNQNVLQRTTYKNQHPSVGLSVKFLWEAEPYETFILQLRSIEGLTDNEAIEVSKVQFGLFKECAGGKDFNLKVVRELSRISVAAITDDGKKCLAKIEVNNEYKLNLRGIDYLRSISIAIPWRDLSVEDLITYNWIKL